MYRGQRSGVQAFLLVLVSAIVAVFVSGASAQSGRIDSAPIRYSAVATNLDPSVRLSITRVDISIDRWSTDNERQRLLEGLTSKGQDELLKRLQDMPRVGTIK